MRRLGVALVSCLLLALACATNPLTRRSELVLVSEQDEIEAGRAGAEQVAAQIGIVDAPALTDYVAAVGARVAAKAPQRSHHYSFLILDQDEPNAFALPGGHVYVSRGLLAIASREDELAGVIAHEVVHVAGRHHAQRQTRLAGVGILALPAVLAGAILGPIGDLIAAPGVLAGAGALASYSRAQELEADRFGQAIAAAAGYDPSALGSFLVALERDTQLRQGEPREPGWLDTHPSNPARAEEAAAHAAHLTRTPEPAIAPDGEAFARRLDGLLIGQNPAEGVFEGPLFLHPDMGFRIEFPADWQTVNTRDAVGAVSPAGDAQVVLRVQGPGDDPREAASDFLQKGREHTRIDVVRLDALRVNQLEAVRGQAVAKTREGSVSLDLTWIAHGGLVYLISGVVPRDYGDAHRAVFGAVVESFRPLSAEERQGVRIHRLRLRRARAGESLTEFGARVGNAWSPERTAVANRFDPGAPLADDQWLRVAIPEPYE
jgi:predicted Zn-dependent protease